MRDNPTHRSFMGYLSKHPTEFPDDIEHYFPLSPQRYKKLKDEVIQMPLEEVDTLPIELQSWILALRPALKKEQTEQEAKKATATTSAEPYKETPHKQEMRNLTERLIEEIDLLLKEEIIVLEITPGQFILAEKRFPISITEGGEMQVAFSIEGEGDKDPLYKALRSHLETGGFAKVLADITSWSKGTADNLIKCHELFTTTRKKLERIYNTSIAISVPLDYQSQPIFTQSAFTAYFPALICADGLEQARGSIGYRDSAYHCDDGLKLEFDVYTIYVGTSDEHMQLFVDAHMEWRARCAMWKQTKAIAKQRQDLDNIAESINQQLKTFMHMERLPGHCELCSTSSVKSV